MTQSAYFKDYLRTFLNFINGIYTISSRVGSGYPNPDSEYRTNMIELVTFRPRTKQFPFQNRTSSLQSREIANPSSESIASNRREREREAGGENANSLTSELAYFYLLIYIFHPFSDK